ncbi:MAG: GGDEF domain-containing protein, partial [Sulfurimonas sp.]|nr:GGDEF domain-containing protein [Sulfurimonas sp.]
KELEKFATIDKLTGIYNRRRIDEFMLIEIEIAKRHSQNLSIILIDIDHFKLVNDTYGHQIGDIVLKKTTEIISQNLRKSDIFGRWGGEEFLIICPHTNEDEALILAQKLRVAIESHRFETVGEKTICLGIAQLKDGDTDKTLMQKVDNALYSAKNGGRNRAVVFA